ncbi:Starch-binding associating with outer membrane [Mariniphaga anaerophila]|uniref:Starch-binding associating with outer membrane n=1 Tax=Mariniphaga anaerophila TaxID=1484053 RepID=A0A1M4SEV5_9BACT|nr:RagB/SusD family nutrient uptake outer membrane protein [Mariniphaga anaerophila]SHE30692.1 Starch-binding associating with outer membrane [Mariniphaga anaerophila]
MKNKLSILIKSITLGIFLAGAVSCEDYLSVDPKSSWVKEAFYENEDEVQMGLAGIYNYLGQDATYGQVISAMFEAGTDEALFNRNNNNWAIGLYNHTPADANLRITWLALYQGIEAANNFIAKVPNTSGIDETTRDSYLGEAYFMRALYYFDLVRWWGEVPLRLTPTAGINDNDLAAASLEEIYQQIITDFTFASEHLPHAKDQSEPGHANKMAAHGMLARVYLTMAGYPMQKTEMYAEAAAQCDIVISDGWHQLNPSYKQVFLNYIENKYDRSESMFEVEFTLMRDQGIREDGRIGQINGAQFYYYPTQTEPFAYAMLQNSVKLNSIYEEGDERDEWNNARFICNSGGNISKVSNELKIWPGKFRRWEPITYGKITEGVGSYKVLEGVATPDKNFTGINYPLLRYADILLMKAECENEINGPANAYQYLDQVRVRAGLQDVDKGTISGKEQFRKEIQDERMRELCFEGVRKHDLIRWNILGESLTELNEMIDATNRSDKDKALYKRAGENFVPSKHTIMPYPIQETTMNQKLDQHSEWLQ